MDDLGQVEDLVQVEDLGTSHMGDGGFGTSHVGDGGFGMSGEWMIWDKWRMDDLGQVKDG